MRQAWEMCEAGPYNLSHKSLSSTSMRQELNKILQTLFYAEITSRKSQDAPSDDLNNVYEEDVLLTGDDDHEDISLSTRQVKKCATQKTRRKGRPSYCRKVQTTKEKTLDSDYEEEAGMQRYDGLATVGGKIELVNTMTYVICAAAVWEC